MKKTYLLILIIGLTSVVILFFFIKNQSRRSNNASSATAAIAAKLPNFKLARPAISADGTNNQFSANLNDQPADVLSATNLEQWRSLIKDLRHDPALANHWDTRRLRPRPSPAILRHNGKTVIYEMKAVDVTLFPNTTNMMEARLYSPSMNIEQTRELGLQLCRMFGHDSNKFTAWCNTVGNKWLDAPLFDNGDEGDFSHFFAVHRTYNNEKPWYIIFTIQQESAIRKWLRESLQSGSNGVGRH